MGIGTVISSLLAIVLSLALVLGLAWGAIWLLRTWQDRALGPGGGAAAGDRSLRFIRALPLGQRERVALIEVGDETMLLGIGGGTITLLSRWAADGAALPVPAPDGGAPAATPAAPRQAPWR